MAGRALTSMLVGLLLVAGGCGAGEGVDEAEPAANLDAVAEVAEEPPAADDPDTAADPAPDAADESTEADGVEAEAGEWFYPLAVGNWWEFGVSFSNDTPDVRQFSEIVRLDTDGDAIAATFAQRHSSANEPDLEVDLSYLFFPDGSIGAPYNAMSMDAVQVEVLDGRAIVWPSAAQLDSGEVFDGQLHIRVTIGGNATDVVVSYTAQGDGRQTVTVPAGTFADAHVMTLATNMAIGGTEATNDIRMWFVPGVGNVKQEIFADLGMFEVTTVVELLASNVLD